MRQALKEALGAKGIITVKIITPFQRKKTQEIMGGQMT
jgi:hypothetical protein